MKNIIKNLVVPLIFSGLFFVPVLSSAQTSEGIINDSNNFLIPTLNNDKSQAEIEAIEQMQILEAKFKLRRLYLKRSKKIKKRVFASISKVINDDRSQAEVEAEEVLLFIQAIPDFQKLNRIDPVQASSQQFSLISDLMALNYDEEMSVLQNIK